MANRGRRYTDRVSTRLTITVRKEVAAWARKKAAEENTSVSKLVSRMLESQMRMGDEFRHAPPQMEEDPESTCRCR